MTIWRIEEAGTRLSEVIEEAACKGPQIITQYGVERAAVLSMDDYRALTTRNTDLRAHLLGGPKVGVFVISRSRNRGRKVSP